MKDHPMDKPTPAETTDLGTLVEDARALLIATADVAGEKVADARKRLTTALDRDKDMYHRVRDRAVEGARATNVAVHEHPYPAIGIAIAIALGVGSLVGFLLGHRQ